MGILGKKSQGSDRLGAQMLSSVQKALLFVAATLILIFFQNCGPAGFEPVDGLNLGLQQQLDLPSEEPTPDPTPLEVAEEYATLDSFNDAFPAGDFVDDCLTDDNYNACLVYKDPVSANNGPFAVPLNRANSTPQVELRIFNYGINLPEDGQLTNAHYTIVNPTGTVTEAKADGSWKYSFAGDTNHDVGQINAFYWLNRQITYMKERTGRFYAENRDITVFAYDDINANAYWSFVDQEIHMGYAPDDPDGDLSVDVSVLAHEAGHGNVYWGTRQQVRGSELCQAGNPNSGPCCPDADGCYDAMNEAIGDIHSFILFNDLPPAIGLYFFNDTDGLRDPAIVQDNNLTAQQVADAAGRRIHNTGLTYSSVWYEIWAKYKAQGNEKVIEEIFTEHIAALDANDNFTSAFDIIETVTPVVDPVNAAQIIQDFQAEYDRLVITRN